MTVIDLRSGAFAILHPLSLREAEDSIAIANPEVKERLPISKDL
jgi:hypothetical protein